jgi:hypothetical protein
MAAPAITPETRYFNPATSKLYWVPAISNKSAPTRPELDAGKNLSAAVADINGWTVTSELIDTPDMGSTFVGKIAGRTSADNSSITFYSDVAGVDARTLMPRTTTGFIVWLDGGDTSGRKMDVYPVTVSSVGKIRSVGNEAARLTIMYAITSVPAEDVTIP